MLGLRTSDGLDLDRLGAEFGPAVPREILQVMAQQPPGLVAGAYTRPHLRSTRAVFVTETSKAPQRMGQKVLTWS